MSAPATDRARRAGRARRVARRVEKSVRPVLENLESRVLFAVVGTGKGLVGNYFSDNNLTNLALARSDSTVNFTFDTGAPAAGVPAEGFSARWTGQVQASVSQTYTFHLDSAGGARLYVNGALVVDDWALHARRERTGTIALTEGHYYDIRLEYRDQGTSAVRLLWSGPSTTKAVVPTTQLYRVGTAPLAGGWLNGDIGSPALGGKLSSAGPGTITISNGSTTAAGTVTGLTLMNAATDVAIGPFTSGTSLDLSGGRQYNVRAETSGSIGSIVFTLDGAHARTESFAPYTVAGDAGTDYFPWSLSAGAHTLVATPYSGQGGTGTPGAPVTVNFTAANATSGGTVTLPAAADGHVRDGTYAATSFGSGTNMEVKWVTAPGYTRETYLRFDLTGVGPAGDITSAKLRLFGRMLDTKVPGMVVELRPVSNATWSESGLTWKTKPAAGATPLAYGNIAGSTGAWYEFDVADYLRQQKAAGATAVAFALRAQSTGEGWAGFASDEAAANRPALVVGQAASLVAAARPVSSQMYLTPGFTVPSMSILPAGATADRAHFAYKTLRGNGTIIARVTRTAGSFAESGIMVRTDTSAGSPFVDLTLSGNGASLDYRTGQGLASRSSGSVLLGGSSAWLKLVRDGNSFAGYVSSTGADNSWRLVGTAGVIMPTFAHFGLEAAGTSGLNASTFTNVSVRPNNPLGGNLNMQSDRIEDHPFTDLVKLTRGFFNLAGRLDNTGRVALANADANGWPTEDFSVTVVDHSEWNVPAEAGTYRMSFNGPAGVTVTALAGSGVTLARTGFNATTGLHTYDVTVPAGVLKVGFNFRSTGGQVRNLKVLQPGYSLSSYPTYTHRYLNLLRDLRPNTIRLMDFTKTLASPVANWSDRARPSDATWGRVDLRGDRLQSYKGVPWEQGIQLANAIGANVWISVPHLATDDYVRNLATLLKNTLRKDLNIFFEHSNEVWNAGYEQSRYNKTAAVQEVIAEARAGRRSNLNYDNRTIDFTRPDHTNPNADTWGDRRHARRTKQIGDIFRSVWTSARLENPINTRVRPVLAGQVASLSRFDNELNFINSVFGAPRNYFYALGVAPYFGLNRYTSTPGATKEQILEGMNLSITASWQNGTALDTTLSKAKNWGLRMVGYEGGPDTFGDLNIAAKRAATLDPQMRAIVERYLNIWYSKGGDQFNWYTLGSRSFNTPFGTWSITDNANVYTQPKQLGFKTIRDAVPVNGTAGSYVFA